MNENGTILSQKTNLIKMLNKNMAFKYEDKHFLKKTKQNTPYN